MYLNDIYTVAVNLAGIPGISVPFSSAENGPYWSTTGARVS